MNNDPAINKSFISRDLTLQAIQGFITPKYPLEKEIRLLKEILCRRKRHRPIVIGERGVGKRVLIELLALSMVLEEGPLLNSMRILELDTKRLLSPESDISSSLLEHFIGTILGAENIILFIEDIDLFYRDGEKEKMIQDILSRSFDNKAFRVIVTTTPEWGKKLLNIFRLDQYFTPLYIKEPAENECIEIVMSMKDTYGKFYGVTLTQDAVRMAVRLSNQYIHNKFQPDKALDVIDSACARAFYESSRNRCLSSSTPAIDSPRASQSNGVLTHTGDIELTVHHIEGYLEDVLGMPLIEKKQKHSELLKDIENHIAREIMGQKEAISALCDALRINLSFPALRGSKPRGVFLLLGPTGVGKTEIVRVLARLLFNNDEAFIRLNMSEYSEPHSVSKLIGAPPGYIGYDDGIVLGELIRRTPHCLLLLDEVEKSHPKVMNLFLQAFDEGKIRDSKGEIISFKETLIFMTGNVGSELLESTENLGFVRRSPEEIEVSENSLDKEIRKYFSREFINRIDRIILFKPLKKETAKQIVREIYLDKLSQLLKEQGVTLKIMESVIDHLADQGFNPRYGVRFLERKFNELVMIPIGRLLCTEAFDIKEITLNFNDGLMRIEQSCGHIDL